MAYIKPGHLTANAYPWNHFASRHTHWPGFLIGSKEEPEPKKEDGFLFKKYVSLLNLCLCIDSEIEFIPSKDNLFLLAIDEDLFLAES